MIILEATMDFITEIVQDQLDSMTPQELMLNVGVLELASRLNLTKDIKWNTRNEI